MNHLDLIKDIIHNYINDISEIFSVNKYTLIDIWKKYEDRIEYDLYNKNTLIINDFSHVYDGNTLTKEIRHKLFGHVAGGSGSMKPENCQRKYIESITNIKCLKTNLRINKETNTMENVKNPLNKENGFEYTENFDGYQIINKYTIYINLRCVVGCGGSQIRTLKNTYDFIKCQINFLANHENDDILFANILDGDEAYKKMKQFKYLLNDEYIKKNIFVGCLKEYFQWLLTRFSSST